MKSWAKLYSTYSNSNCYICMACRIPWTPLVRCIEKTDEVLHTRLCPETTLKHFMLKQGLHFRWCDACTLSLRPTFAFYSKCTHTFVRQCTHPIEDTGYRHSYAAAHSHSCVVILDDARVRNNITKKTGTRGKYFT